MRPFTDKEVAQKTADLGRIVLILADMTPAYIAGLVSALEYRRSLQARQSRHPKRQRKAVSHVGA